MIEVMAQTFFFYDLETSGLSARDDRIMQIAGQRTDMNLQPIGDPVNILVALNDDTLPSPDALMVTGITPQQSVADGYTEAQAAKMLMEEVFTPETVTVGFNSIRFDDEFIRHLFWRTFQDPYEWAWKEGRSRWDILDVVRMTRALRPGGIEWPIAEDGRPTNRLEVIAAANGIVHTKAHDALSDVEALISLTQLIRSRQPQLFDYLFKMRGKNEIKTLVNLEDRQPFVYTSGRYDNEFHKTTVAFPLGSGKNGNVMVYDLRHDPTQFIDMDAKALAKKLYASWEERKAEDFVKLPVKELQYNRAPAVAPLAVLHKEEGWERLGLDHVLIKKHTEILLSAPHFAENLRTLFENKPEYKKSPNPEAQLYDGFLNDRDRLRVEIVRNASERELVDFLPEFVDERLAPLLLHYKARNFPKTLNDNEAQQWEKWRTERLTAQLPGFMKSLNRLVATETNEEKIFILQELQLWLESIAPSDVGNQDSSDGLL